MSVGAALQARGPRPQTLARAASRRRALRLASAAALAAALSAALPASAAQREHRWSWRSRPSPDAVRSCRDEMLRIIEVAPGAAEGIPRALREATPAWIDVGVLPNSKEEGEPFLFPGLEHANRVRTASEPYDALATALLLVARDHFGQDQLSIRSSAKWEEWAPGAALYEKALGRAAQPPFDKRAALSVEPRPALFGVLLAGALAIFAVLGLIGLGKRPAQ